MQTQNQIENFLFQGKFDEARECLNNGEKFNEHYLKNNFSQIAAKIIEAKEIDFTEKLIKAGFIETDMTSVLPEDQQKALNAQIPLGHMGKPQDIAHAVAYLASISTGTSNWKRVRPMLRSRLASFEARRTSSPTSRACVACARTSARARWVSSV